MEETRKDYVDKIDVVIVTYNSTNTIKELLEKIYEDVNKIYIIDNNSINKKEIENLDKIYKNVNLILNKENLGLARAQNIGIEESLKNNSSFILFLDDDSIVSYKFIKTLLNEYYKNEDKNKIAILSPEIIQIIDTKKQKTKIQYKKDNKIKREYLKENETRIDTVFAISSGSMIKTDILKKIGKFEENYFIDDIDTEYSMRVIAENYKILVTSKASLYQRYGEKKEKKILFFKIYPTNHSPERLYYKYRNFKYNEIKYKNILPIQVAFLKKHKILNFFRVILFEKEKIKKIKFVLKGLKDAEKNKL